MAYNQNIPQPNDKLSQSQSDIQQNFAALATQLNPAAKTALFPARMGDPAGIATTIQLYARADVDSVNGTGLFLSRATGADPNLIIPITQAIINGVNGYTFLPSGLLIQWGTSTTPTPNNMRAVYQFTQLPMAGPGAVNIDFPNTCFFVLGWPTGITNNPNSFTVTTDVIDKMSFWASGHLGTGYAALPFKFLALGI